MAKQSMTLDRMSQEARRVLSGFTTGQKVVTLLAVAALVLASVMFYNYAAAPTYAPLFSGLKPTDAAAITQKLVTDKVPYQLINGGSTIMVPQSDVYQERLNMAQAGLPSSGTVGFSALQSTGITTSQFVQQVDYQQGLESQLGATIQSIQGVSAAQVSLVIPQPSPFALNSTQKPTASIMVALSPGTSLTSGQIQAIVHLTASAVPGLSPSNVTVVDTTGQVLSAPGVNVGANSNSQATSSYDAALAASLQSMLDNVVGVNNAAVTVHATLNFNQSTTTSKLLQVGPKGAVVTAPLSTQTSTQKSTGAAQVAGGVLGAGAAPAAAPGATSASTSSSVQNAVGQVNTVVQQAPGTVSQNSVAVLLNSSAMKGVSVAQVRQLVTAAAGLNLARGDTIVVSQMPFSTAMTKAAALAQAQAKAAAQLANYESMARTAALVLVALVAVFLLLRASKRAARNAPPPSTIVTAGPRPELSSSVTMMLPTVPKDELETPALTNDEINAFIDGQPDEVAELLRSWTTERADRKGRS